MNRNGWVWPGVLILSSLGVSLFALFDWHGPLRPIITLWFCVLCPGMALVRLAGFRTAVPNWTLAIAFSLALVTLVGIVLLYSGKWSWQNGLAILVGFTLFCTLLDLILNRPIQPEPAVLVKSLPARDPKTARK